MPTMAMPSVWRTCHDDAKSAVLTHRKDGVTMTMTTMLPMLVTLQIPMPMPLVEVCWGSAGNTLCCMTTSTLTMMKLMAQC